MIDSLRMMKQDVPLEMMPREGRKMIGKDLGKTKDKEKTSTTMVVNLFKKINTIFGGLYVERGTDQKCQNKLCEGGQGPPIGEFYSQ